VANRAVLPPSLLRAPAGSAAASAPRTAAPPLCPPRPAAAGFGRRCRVAGLALDALHHVDQHLGRAQIGTRLLSTICVTIAARLVSFRRRPSIVTTPVSFSASASNAGRLLALRPRQRLTFEAPEGPFYIGVRGDNPNAADIRSRA